jgi:predicted alpha/beta superfamily hydrolase
MLTILRAAAITWTLLVFPALAISQAQPSTTFAPVVKGLVLQDVECSEFHSRFTGHDYHVYVSLPASYRQGDRRYPVLYVPDLDEGFLSLKGANRMMGFAKLEGMEDMLEEFILVGVPLKWEGVSDWARQRAFDLTPTDVETVDTSFSKLFGGDVKTGGGPMFLRTLKEELIPLIESKYRANSDRGLAGFSLGGLFAAYVWVYDSNTFSRYLIGSPSLWWDNGMILKAEAAKGESDKGLHGRVFLSIGADESEELSSFKNLTTALKTHAYPNLQVETHIFEGENHLSVVQATFSRGLRFLYAKPRQKQ